MTNISLNTHISFSKNHVYNKRCSKVEKYYEEKETFSAEHTA